MPPSPPVTLLSPPLAIVARLLLLAVVTVLTLIVTRDAAQLWWIALLAVAGLPGIFTPHDRRLSPLGRFTEVVLVGLGAGTVATVADAAGTIDNGFGAQALLPYLTVPLIAAALRRRSREGVALLGVAAASLIIGGALGASPRPITELGYLAAIGQWLITGAIITFAVGTMRRLLQPRDTKPQPYAEATRLLTQLRSVARQLPGATLDPGGISEHLLEELRSVAPADRAAVLSPSGGGRLVVLAQSAVERVDWETTLDADSAIADAWASQQPQTANRSQARSHRGGDVSALVVPLVAGVRTVALVALETDTAAAYPPAVVARLTALTGPSALRLEAALLFDESARWRPTRNVSGWPGRSTMAWRRNS